MQKRFSRAKKTYHLWMKTNKAPNWIIREIGIDQEKCHRDWRTKEMRRSAHTWNTKLLNAAKCHRTTEMFWLNHVEKCEPLYWYFRFWISLHVIRWNLHAFWGLPLVLQAQTFYFFRSLLFFHSFFHSSPFFSLKEENCFVRQILFTVRLQITISTDFGENSWYFLSLSLSLSSSRVLVMKEIPFTLNLCILQRLSVIVVHFGSI